jgi:hypothetical protein
MLYLSVGGCLAVFIGFKFSYNWFILSPYADGYFLLERIDFIPWLYLKVGLGEFSSLIVLKPPNVLFPPLSVTGVRTSIIGIAYFSTLLVIGGF